MLRALLEITGLGIMGVGAYIIGKRDGIEKGKELGVESGVRIGFAMAPALYSQMEKDGLIKMTPKGMTLGEVGRAFKTKEEAFEFRRKLVVMTGCNPSDLVCMVTRNTKGECGDMYIVAYDKTIDSGRE